MIKEKNIIIKKLEELYDEWVLSETRNLNSGRGSLGSDGILSQYSAQSLFNELVFKLGSGFSGENPEIKSLSDKLKVGDSICLSVVSDIDGECGCSKCCLYSLCTSDYCNCCASSDATRGNIHFEITGNRIKISKR